MIGILNFIISIITFTLIVRKWKFCSLWRLSY